MTLFTVQATGTDDDALARARFVAERFSWPAFWLTWAWLLYRRLWLAFLLWVVIDLAFLLLAAPHLPMGAIVSVEIAARIVLGLEAGHLRIGKGARRATLTELVEARDRDEAEAIFFARRRPPIADIA